MKNDGYINYGDVNPEDGSVFIKHDTFMEDSEVRCFHIVATNFVYDTDTPYQLTTCYLDLDDTWIDWDAVKNSLDVKNDADDYELACAVYHYYGAWHISGDTGELHETPEDLYKELALYKITEYE